MKILVDIGHPAHVHFFKNTIWALKAKGHEVEITARDKEISFKLLNLYNFKYYNRGKHYKGLINKAIGMILIDLRLYKFARKFNPDILIGLHNPYIAHIGKLLGKKVLIFTDTEHASIANMITFPFADAICTPNCFKNDLGPKQIRYKGYHELAYLHPNYFTPDPSVLNEMGLTSDEKFIILRFVAWSASHDIGQRGISLEMKQRFVHELKKYGKVFITSETNLPEELEPYRIAISPEKMHNLLYYATLLVGESATMASECAVLGTPAIYIDFAGRGYTDEEEKDYGLVYNFKTNRSDQERALNKSIELIKNKDLKKESREKRIKLLNESIDVTEFMINLIESFSKNDLRQEI